MGIIKTEIVNIHTKRDCLKKTAPYFFIYAAGVSFVVLVGVSEATVVLVDVSEAFVEVVVPLSATPVASEELTVVEAPEVSVVPLVETVVAVVEATVPLSTVVVADALVVVVDLLVVVVVRFLVVVLFFVVVTLRVVVSVVVSEVSLSLVDSNTHVVIGGLVGG